MSIAAEVNDVSSSTETEIYGLTISSPLIMQQSIMSVETSEMSSWDMRAYIQSLPTREDMDKYVRRLETSYKAELQLMKTALEDTQSRMLVIVSKMKTNEQKTALYGIRPVFKIYNHCH